jgi:hypothetical protein
LKNTQGADSTGSQTTLDHAVPVAGPSVGVFRRVQFRLREVNRIGSEKNER